MIDTYGSKYLTNRALNALNRLVRFKPNKHFALVSKRFRLAFVVLFQGNPPETKFVRVSLIRHLCQVQIHPKWGPASIPTRWTISCPSTTSGCFPTSPTAGGWEPETPTRPSWLGGSFRSPFRMTSTFGIRWGFSGFTNLYKPLDRLTWWQVFFHFPLLPAFLLSDLFLAPHFHTVWLSRLGIGNQ